MWNVHVALNIMSSISRASENRARQARQAEAEISKWMNAWKNILGFKLCTAARIFFRRPVDLHIGHDNFWVLSGLTSLYVFPCARTSRLKQEICTLTAVVYKFSCLRIYKYICNSTCISYQQTMCIDSLILMFVRSAGILKSMSVPHILGRKLGPSGVSLNNALHENMHSCCSKQPFGIPSRNLGTCIFVASTTSIFNHIVLIALVLAVLPQ